MGSSVPRIDAGHDISCPYEDGESVVTFSLAARSGTGREGRGTAWTSWTMTGGSGSVDEADFFASRCRAHSFRTSRATFGSSSNVTPSTKTFNLLA